MKLAFASCNTNKINEIKDFVKDRGFSVYSQLELNVKDIEETGETFKENALLKAYHLAEYVDFPVIADDSGLIIDELGGIPGVKSARFAGDNANSQANREKLEKILQNNGLKKAAARFHSTVVLVMSKDDSAPLIASGELHGYILAEQPIDTGFGYEPMLYLPDHDCMVSDLSVNEKNQISHRAKAFHLILEKLKNERVAS